MSESIIVALITGGVSLIGTVITVIMANNKTAASVQTAQAVTDTKIEALTESVKEHNNYAKRMPVVEEQIKVLNHRVADLEANMKMTG